jgi:hypothetical protein
MLHLASFYKPIDLCLAFCITIASITVHIDMTEDLFINVDKFSFDVDCLGTPKKSKKRKSEGDTGLPGVSGNLTYISL